MTGFVNTCLLLASSSDIAFNPDVQGSVETAFSSHSTDQLNCIN